MSAPATASRAPRILGLGGTGRAGSSCDRALALVLDAARDQGAEVECFSGGLLDLPHFDFAGQARLPAARRLIEAVSRADGLILASPCYHGGVSGLVKGALDYLEDLRDAPRPYLDGRAVGLVVTAHGAQALGTTLGALRGIVHALRGWPTPFALAINSSATPLGPSGAEGEAHRQAAAAVAAQVIAFARGGTAAPGQDAA
ncbi:MAG: NAD(P)H-dependent oxidoreductase [Rhodobacteraceae bacterium]|nr:NAD(P)H-dependent oxidoreductase [Paracoccaceae bacterium]